MHILKNPAQMNPGSNSQQSSFGSFNATQIFCPKCNTAMPVKEHLVIHLPSGALYHYRCARCNTTLGKRQT